MAFAKLDTSKQPIEAADLLNDCALLILTDGSRSTADRHDYQLYLALNDIDHTKTKAKSPQTNGICELIEHLPRKGRLPG